MRSPVDSLTWTLAARFLLGDKSRVLAGTARAAIASIAIGVLAMVIGMALMSGYRHDLERRLLAGSAAVGVFPIAGAPSALEPDPLRRLTSIEGVAAVGRVVYGQGSMASGSAAEGVDLTLRGVDPGGPDLTGRPIDLASTAEGLPEIVPGAELAADLGIADGDVVRLTVLDASSVRPRFRYRSAVVREPFRSGYFEFDRSWAVVDRGFLAELTGLRGSFELTLEDPEAAGRVAEEARTLLGPDFDVRNFRNANQELFEALEWQQALLFLVLGLIVVVSTFNVASTLVVLVRERWRQLGVLAAMGTPPRQLAAVFVVYGGLVGAAGIVLGLAGGSLAAWILDEFEIIRLGSGLSSIYFLSAVPFRLRWWDLGAIGSFALLVTVAACILPARRAASLDPAAALRYQ